MIEIGPLGPRDLTEAGIVLDAAFGRRGMTESLRNAYRLQPGYWFCARRLGQIVATVGAYGYGGSGPGGPTATIGMMAVDPRRQKEGLGRRLMEHLVQHLTRAGYRSLFLEASPAGQHLYPKLGFWSDGETLRMVKQMPARATFPTVGGVSAMFARDLPEVIAYDGSVFGVERPNILRAVFERDPARCFIARYDNDALCGYLFASGLTLGPWSAASPATAESLLQAALTLPQLGELRATFPAENRAAHALLSRYGFVPTEGLVHMRLGDAPDSRRRTDYYGQAGLMLG
jgi:predicted N-acetyltransferase YhbS